MTVLCSEPYLLLSIYFLTRFGKLIHVPLKPCPLLLQSQLWVPLVALGRHILQLSLGKCSICEQFRRNSKQKRCAAANVYFIYNCTTFIIFFSTCTFSWLFLFRRADFSDFFFLIMDCTYQIMSANVISSWTDHLSFSAHTLHHFHPWLSSLNT